MDCEVDVLVDVVGCEVEEVVVVEVVGCEGEDVLVEVVGCEVDKVLVVEVVGCEVDEVLVVEVMGCEVEEVLVVEVVVDVVPGLRAVCGWEVISVWVEGNSDMRIVVISSDAVNNNFIGYTVILNKQCLYECLPVVLDSSMGRIVLGVVGAIIAGIK